MSERGVHCNITGHISPCDVCPQPAQPNKPGQPECPRCGDMFYHPKVVIEDHRQHAAEWEDMAKRAEAERDRMAAELAEAKERLQVAELRELNDKYERDRLAKECAELRASLKEILDHSDSIDKLQKLIGVPKIKVGRNDK